MSLAEDTAANIRRRLVGAISRRLGLKEKIAEPIAEEVIEALRDLAPGRELYIPAQDKAARNAAIRCEFNGRNREEVCKKYEICERQLYRIIGKGRAVSPPPTLDPERNPA